MNHTNAAVDREKAANKRTMQELNERFKDCKTEEHEYQIGGERCMIVRHYCGDKDLNEVLYRNAFEKAFSEVMDMHRHPQTAE